MPREEKGERGGARTPAGRGSFFASLLLSTIDSLDSAAKVRESLAFAYWPQVAGPQAAAATEVEAVRDGVLFVRTKSSVWSHELTLHRERLIAGLNRRLGGRFITEIVYKARGVKKARSRPPEPDAPELDELDGVVLDPAEQAELAASLRSLESIGSERIRGAIASRVIREAKLRHWRIERGWKLCARCSGLHKTESRLCPLCRLCP